MYLFWRITQPAVVPPLTATVQQIVTASVSARPVLAHGKTLNMFGYRLRAPLADGNTGLGC